jgi:hypothetical protein
MLAGPVGAEDGEGPDESAGDGVEVGLLGVLPLVEVSTTGRFEGAATQSGRLCRSLPNDPRPPRPMYVPRDGGT